MSEASNYTMNIIDAIRTLRKEKNMTYEQAKRVAVDNFIRLGLHVPESILRITQ